MTESPVLHQETHLEVLCLLQGNTQMNQRELAAELVVSLGKAIYCLKALLDKGLLKAQNFRNSNRKRAFCYLLTPAGLAEKTFLTGRFLARKMYEFEQPKAEITLLQQESEPQKTRLTSGMQSPCKW